MMYSLPCINHFLEVNNLVINSQKKYAVEKKCTMYIKVFLPLSFKVSRLQDTEQCFKMLKPLERELTCKLWGIAVKVLEVAEN